MIYFQHGLALRGTQTAYVTLTSAVAFTPPSGATHMIVQAHAAAIWYTIDGTTPTAAAPAFTVAAADSDIIRLPQGIDAVRIIGSGANISYVWATDTGV